MPIVTALSLAWAAASARVEVLQKSRDSRGHIATDTPRLEHAIRELMLGGLLESDELGGLQISAAGTLALARLEELGFQRLMISAVDDGDAGLLKA